MAQLLFYRYTDDREAASIRRDRRIALAPGQVCKWYTPNRFDAAIDARRFLALAYLPTHRVGPIPVDELPDFDHAPLRLVGPDYGQPGGGLEAATTRIAYLFDITRIS